MWFEPDGDDISKRMMDRRRSAEFQASQAEARRVTQSISIKKPPMLRNLDTDSPMASPGSYGSSPPASPSLASPSPSSKYNFLLLHTWWICMSCDQRALLRSFLSIFFGHNTISSPRSHLVKVGYSLLIVSPVHAVFKDKEKRWRSVFHPDGREISRSCSAKFENVPCNSPTVYDW